MLADEPTGQPMKRRSTVSGKPAQLRGPKASKSKRVSRPREASRSTSSAVDNEGEVARLTRELDEAREQQTATSEVLRIISSSPGELQPVFDAILNNAVRICAAQNATLWLFGDGRFRSVARFADIPDVGLDQTQPGPNRASAAFGQRNRSFILKTMQRSPLIASVIRSQFAPWNGLAFAPTSACRCSRKTS
jgi:hypothetical protein